MILGVEFIIFTIAVALLFDFFNGVNDAANSIATVVATRVLRPIQATLWAGIFNFLGPILGGTAVAATVGKGIVLPSIITPELILGALVGAIIWTWVCTHFGIPISVSHSLIGGLVGAGFAAAGFGALDLPTFAKIQPVLLTMRDGALVGFLFGVVLALINRKSGSQWVPFLGAFLGSGIWLSIRIFGGTLAVKGITATILFIFYSPMLGFVGGYLLNLVILWLFRRARPQNMRKYFGVLQLLSSAFYSYGHGTNDGQKTMGIITALLIAVGWVVPVGDAFPIPWWVVISSALAIALGTIIGGYKVVRTMGMRLTQLRTHQGFAAETSSAFGLYFLAQAGVPVSTTHSITGSILGVGAVHGTRKVRWGVARSIVTAWILTIPAAAIVGATTFFVVTAAARVLSTI
jgi:inorganic phosphate transporter, PiT family